MNSFKKKLYLKLILTSLIVVLSALAAEAQTLSFNYYYSVNMTGADEYPQVNPPRFDYPENARKTGVTGTLKAEMTLGEDGKVKDIVIVQGLPNGVTEAFTAALQNMYFQPAKRRGKPVAVKMTMDFIVTAEYDENDKNVTKAKIIEKPAPVYPPNQMAEKVKGKVEVVVMFFADGKIKVLGVSSVMPKEFDKAAAEAAAKIKFQPAVHKKSKQPVSQQMTVVYEFKP
jgi:TonB family protein